MLEKKSFQITLVRKSKGTDIEVTRSPDKSIQYNGGRMHCAIVRGGIYYD